MTDNIRANRAAGESCASAFARGDIDGALRHVTADFTFTSATVGDSRGHITPGKEANGVRWKEHVSGGAAMVDYKLTVSGDYAAMVWGDSERQCSWFEFRDGKICAGSLFGKSES